jgi:REP element-mobilizing transposase RayT
MIENPNKFANKFKLKSSRLQNWDYSNPGYYFITICTYNHNNFFGKIINNKMELSKMGIIAQSELLKTFEIRKNIKLHKWVIMPNHVHILMEIIKQNNQNINTFNKCRDVAQCRDVLQNISTDNINKNQYFSNISPKSNSISNIIKQFKSAVTRQINPKTIFFAWQSRFYDEIIKDEKELSIIKNYIINNPINWQKDKFYKN